MGAARRAVVGTVRAAATAALWPLDVMLRRSARPLEQPPCFILGPPRSGTTLFHEALVRTFHCAYITNAAHRFFRTPVAATRLARGAIEGWSGSFRSDYGHIEGWGAPSDGGFVWDRWMPENTYLDETAADRLPVELIRRTVAGIAHVLDAPFVNKNIMHSVHMRALDRLFPGCIFVEIRRDAADNARSIVRARHAGVPPYYDSWWAVKPPGCDGLERAGFVEQACGQVLHTRAQIESDIERLGVERRIVVEYERLCASPSEELDRVAAFLGERGAEVEGKTAPPAPFERSSRPALSPAEERELAECLARREGRA